MKINATLQRAFFLLLSAALLLCLAACGQMKPESVAPAPLPEAAVTPTPEPSPTPEATPLPEEMPEPSMPPLPDVDITSWEFLVANSYNSIGEYAPPYAGFEGQGIDARIAEALSAFINAARAEGYEVYGAVTYRNYEYLTYHYLSMLLNYDSAAETCAHYLGFGVNEHETGLAIDFTTRPELRVNYDDFFGEEGFEDTELYQWLCAHCAEYGFILRYPEGKEAYYGTACCPASHFRYVGEEAAAYIMENGLCLEEFILLYDPDAIYVPGL